MTTAEMLKTLEERAREIEKKGTFNGSNYAGIACVLLAGLELMATDKEKNGGTKL